MLGARVVSAPDPERPDTFLLWVESNQDGNYERLNKLFLQMRQSDIYAYKRLSMKLQYEVLSIGLKKSIELINQKFNKTKELTPE